MNSTVASPSSPAASPSQASSLRAVPRAIWIALGAMALATAGLAGALIARSAAPDALQAAAAQPVAGPTAQVTAAGPSPVTALTAPPAIAAPTQAQPAHAAPAQRPQPVRQAHSTAPAPSHAAGTQAQYAPAAEPVRAAVCASCGTVESVHAVQQQGQGSGLGIVAGGVVGGLLGHQVGGGNGKKAMTVLGAVGGGLAGNEVEKRARATTVYDVQVRMEDGSLRSFRRSDAMASGTRVVVEGSTLRVAPDNASAPAPRTLRTSAQGMNS